MNVVLNGELMRLDETATVRDVVRLVIGAEKGVAVSIDRQIIPRSEWSTRPLHDGAVVEVLVAAAGG